MDVDHLRNEHFILILTKALKEHMKYFLPLHRFHPLLDRLQPVGSYRRQVHRRDLDPHVRLYRVHAKVIFTTANTKLRILSIKIRKIHLEQFLLEY